MIDIESLTADDAGRPVAFQRTHDSLWYGKISNLLVIQKCNDQWAVSIAFEDGSVSLCTGDRLRFIDVVEDGLHQQLGQPAGKLRTFKINVSLRQTYFQVPANTPDSDIELKAHIIAKTRAIVGLEEIDIIPADEAVFER